MPPKDQSNVQIAVTWRTLRPVRLRTFVAHVRRPPPGLLILPAFALSNRRPFVFRARGVPNSTDDILTHC
jgi:hypothetical protein